ncbi:hypothetical protein [Paenibacillus sinopodophylli]|uniref:hypothetical protein n=1 Tax=Paenibacillus sinopodophylli TaxID=1837342 RepID=UPI00110CE290|nr:hypothetical protein [Paenibacillus sinopodophylli]
MKQFTYMVNDDNMSGVGIRCGDIVTIQQTQIYEETDIVAIASEEDISKLVLTRGFVIKNSSEEVLVVGKVTKVNIVN